MKQNIIIHHSAGYKYGNGETPERVWQDFNRTGFDRGYKNNGYDFKTGYSEKYGQCKLTHNGSLTFCEYHYGIYMVSPGQYQLVSFIDDREMSSGSIGEKRTDETDDQMKTRARLWNNNSYTIVFCWNAEIENIPESMIEYFIGLFKQYAPLSGLINADSRFYGHKDTKDPTACPGKYLYTYIRRIEDEIKAEL